MKIKRGNIFLAGLDPVIGKEISKTRPVVVISNDLNNQFSGTVTVLPITSKNSEKTYPFEVFLAGGTFGLTKDSKIKTDQIRTLDKRRLLKFIGKLEIKEMEAVEKALTIHLGFF
jgi:mRNA interferase MazF